ncbi:MAG: helix-turn-helix domain-containing protein [Clostridia bacterium]|nr:helix-turn-helix domain-containing protein [Clostridia bacterium]
MGNSVGYSKKLCMSELRATHSYATNAHYYDAGAGRVYSSFGFVIKGEVTLHTAGKRIAMGTGSLFYIPEGIRYHSVWHGAPEIEFYALEIVSKRPDPADTPNYAMAHLAQMSTPETQKRFEQIYELFATGERTNKIRAIGLYYEFYADVLPYLQQEPPLRQHASLRAALDYIEQNCHTDFDISALAAHCCISESRLYHIFKRELDTTPIHYRNELRVENAAALLRDTDLPMDGIADRCGFHSASYFRETFREFTGMTPSEYRHLTARNSADA